MLRQFNTKSKNLHFEEFWRAFLKSDFYAIALISLLIILWLTNLGSHARGASVAIQEPQPTISKTEVMDSQSSVRVIRMKVTGYCPCEICCEHWAELGPDRTIRRGRKASDPDGAAADYGLLSVGTILEVPGAGRRIVDDTGGDMRKSAKEGITHIDIRFVVRDPDGTVNLEKSHQKAKRWAVKWLDVKVLTKGEKPCSKSRRS